jgi:hypothetical protein
LTPVPPILADLFNVCAKLLNKKKTLHLESLSNPFLGGGTFTRPGLSLVMLFVNQPKLLLLPKWNAMHFFPNRRRLLLNPVLDHL